MALCVGFVASRRTTGFWFVQLYKASNHPAIKEFTGTLPVHQSNSEGGFRRTLKR
jgi:hypothetical protein